MIDDEQRLLLLLDELRTGNGTLLCTFSECKVRDGAPDGAREKIDKISN